MNDAPITKAFFPIPPGIESRDDYREGCREGYAEYSETENPFATGQSELPDLMGGYSLFAVTDDGETLCVTCVEDPSNPVHDDRVPAGSDPNLVMGASGIHGDGWGVIAFDHTGNCDTDEVNCAHCNKVIYEYDG
jgi:hypothetical protein